MTTTDRIIMVVGMPSGGTSLVAGLLHHLGVDMGRVPCGIESERQPHGGFECLDAREGIRSAFDPERTDDFMASALEYLDARRADARGPIGVKHNPLVWLGAFEDVADVPIRTIAVHRPLDDVARSDRRYHGDDFDRAARLGKHWLAMQRLLEQIPPAATVDFDRIRENPWLAVESVIHAFDLTPTSAQIDAARGFVKPSEVGEAVLELMN